MTETDHHRPVSTLTRDDNYFEEFEEGDVYRHPRGKTLSEGEMHAVTHGTMNTAEAHFNADKMADSSFESRINYGGLTMSIVFGLASEWTTENALRTTRLDDIRFHAPVWAGDTLYAVTEVLESEALPDENAGKVRFKHYGVNQDDEQVFSGTRTVVVKTRAADGVEVEK